MSSRSRIPSTSAFDADCALTCSVVLAVPVALVMLFLIRADVRRLMVERRRVSGVIAALPVERIGAPALQLVTAPAPAEPQRDAARAIFSRMRRARWRAAAFYFLAAFAACALATVGGNAAADRWTVTMRFFEHFWPVMLTVTTVLLTTFRARVVALGCSAPLLFCVLFLILLVFGLNTEVPPGVPVHVVFPATAVLLIQNRWLRTVAPLLVFVAGVGIVALQLTSIGWAPVVGTLGGGLLALLLMVRAYERKFFSDLSFQLAFVWGLFATAFVANGESPLWTALSLVLFAALTSITLRLVRRDARMHAPASLLVLRVFGTPGRGQRLFEHLGMRWRYAGPIHAIAGADSATANLDLSEAFRFLTLRSRSLYVLDEADLQRRLTELDCAPDPDGRYRINDFFCFDDTWKHTFTELLRRSDAVLVDLSGFSPQNAGVAFELGYLLGQRPLDSFVLVTDRHTDIDHLGATLTRLWRQLDPSLPNASLEHPLVRVLHEPGSRRLVAALCDAAVAGGWRDEPRAMRPCLPVQSPS